MEHKRRGENKYKCNKNYPMFALTIASSFINYNNNNGLRWKMFAKICIVNHRLCMNEMQSKIQKFATFQTEIGVVPLSTIKKNTHFLHFSHTENSHLEESL
jgi:hypothetical protein